MSLNETIYNLPVEQALRVIKREARGKYLCLRVAFYAPPAVSVEDYPEPIHISGYVKVTFKELESFLRGLRWCGQMQPYLISFYVDSMSVFVG